MFDGVVVLSEWFDENRYQRYRNDGMQRGEAQAWINMVELTGIFDGIALDKARELAVFIAQLWSDRIDQRFPGEATRANVVSGEDSDEIFVTIGKFPVMPQTSG
ncbi:hypothetical protein AB6809_28180 [Paraburkholderia sp. RCC_158]|uniref:hypothetical protein n=1 Tax=Paraburkholderia sp. RCC_158 TaxID=3239220 RepID=UPI003523DD69